MADITYLISKITGNKSEGRLQWPAQGLDSAALSGPYGEGSLPVGNYSAPRNKLLDKSAGDSDGAYCDPAGHCWMQVLTPGFSTARTQLAIHPDGNVPGTLGCIGLQDTNTKAWYDAFYAVVGSTSVEVKQV